MELGIIFNSFMKVGWSGENFPDIVYPTLIGKPMMRASDKSTIQPIKSIMIGKEAADARSLLELYHPIDNGIINDWDAMEKIWDFGFKAANANDLADTKILLTEAPFNPLDNREKMAEVMFEKFGFKAVRVGMQAVMALFSEGNLTGLVVDSGDGVTHIMPVYDGNLLEHAVGRLNIAGRHVTKYLNKLLLMRGYAFNSSADFETVREIKEKLCYVSNDIGLDIKLDKETTVLTKQYVLPDNTVINIGKERFEAPECLFKPYKVDSDADGLSEMIFNCIEVYN